MWQLSLNASKTYAHTNSLQDQRFLNNKTVILDGCKLTHVPSAKFLEITIDNLKWKFRMNNLFKVCSRNVGNLNKFNKFYLRLLQTCSVGTDHGYGYGYGYEAMGMVRVRVRDHGYGYGYGYETMGTGMGTGTTCDKVMGTGTGMGTRP